MDTQRNDETKTGMPDMRKADAIKLLKRVKDRFSVMTEADHDNREAAMEDLKFVNVPGEQWESNMKQERGTRPCYEFNKLRISCKRIINDMRANRPDAKVRAVENGDTEKAGIREGLIRNIGQQSDFDTIVDYEGEYQVAAGMGAWRVVTEYVGEDAFNQDILIKPFRNPFTVYCDPQCRDLLKRDAEDWLITDKISTESFEAKWPNATVIDFEGGSSDTYDDEGDWTTEKQTRICEYWYKSPIEKEIWEAVFPERDDDGQPVIDEETGKPKLKTLIVDSTSDEASGIGPDQIKRRRTVMTHEIKWVKCSGDRILEQGDWAGRMFPFVMVYGEYAWVDGKPLWWGLPRFAKDAQRSYNVARTSISETIAGAPKEYYWATSKQAEGHTKEWAEGHKKNYPYRMYEHDPKEPGPPKKVGGAVVPVALMQEAQMASDEINAVTGIFSPDIGQANAASSGRQELVRVNQGEVATFNYQDNMSKGVQRTYEIVLDLIPEIYDTERELRVLGSDGSEDYKKVNEVVLDQITKKAVKVNDLAEGKYDVTITTGPSFSTLRQEASETYSNLAQRFPEIMGVAGDLIMKSMDLPYADDIAERLKTLLPPQIQEQMNADKEIPKEVQEGMMKVQQAMAQVEEQAMMIQEAEAELAKSQSDNESAAFQNKLNQKELEKKIEALRRVKAEFDTHIVKELAGLDAKESVLSAANTGGEGGEADPAMVALAMAVKSLDDATSSFMQETGSMFEELQAIANRKPVTSKAVRSGGKLFSEVQYDDGEVQRIEVNPDVEDVDDGPTGEPA